MKWETLLWSFLENIMSQNSYLKAKNKQLNKISNRKVEGKYMNKAFIKQKNINDL